MGVLADRNTGFVSLSALSVGFMSGRCGSEGPHPASRLTVVLILLACLPGAANAAQDEVRKPVDAWLGPSVMDFDYKEYDNGGRLDHEHGTLYGLTGGLQAAREALLLEGEISWFGNDVNYDGQTQDGVPVRTRTDERILDGQARVGWRFRRQDKLQYQLYGGLGYRDWQRDIRSTPAAPGVKETYTWWYALIGGRGLYHVNQRTTWLAEAQLMRPVDPEIEVNFKNDLDDTRLDLGSKPGVRLSLAWRHELVSGWRLEIMPFYTAWDIGRSQSRSLKQNGVVVGSLYEPRSETRNYGIQARLGVSF
jgi:hypothetical protein